LARLLEEQYTAQLHTLLPRKWCIFGREWNCKAGIKNFTSWEKRRKIIRHLDNVSTVLRVAATMVVIAAWCFPVGLPVATGL